MSHADYMPHGMCLLWEPWLVILWAGSDLLIFASYMAIPFALFTVLRKRKDIPHAGLVALFGGFILLCGLTHMLSIITLWHPIYPFTGFVKLATGLVSILTAIVLFRLIPALIAFPSPAEMTRTNARLRDEIASHQTTLASLERTVEERTAELSALNATLAVQTREAVHRSSNLLSVVVSLAVQTARGARETSDFIDTFVARVRALATATKTIEKTDETAIPLERVIEQRLEMFGNGALERISTEGPPIFINQEAAQQISLALHELATNAHKHSVPNSSGLRIAIAWSIENGTFSLEWRETGLEGLDGESASAPEGFGTQLLTRVVPTMLQGEAERSLEAGGLTYRLTVPLEAVEPDDDGDDARLAARIVDDTFGLETRLPG